MCSILKTISLSLVASLVYATAPGQPVMGYYADTSQLQGKSNCWLQEGYLKVQSDYIKHTGMDVLGYDFIIMGDCW
jgi:hypothetical protein